MNRQLKNLYSMHSENNQTTGKRIKFPFENNRINVGKREEEY